MQQCNQQQHNSNSKKKNPVPSFATERIRYVYKLLYTHHFFFVPIQPWQPFLLHWITVFFIRNSPHSHRVFRVRALRL